MESRAKNEIEHGKLLANGDTELIWGWGSPAGRLRAKRRADMIISGVGLSPGMRVLEIGCGTGLFTEYFTQSGVEIIAVDISPSLIQKAKTRNRSSNVKFLVRRFEECDVEGPFDAIIGSSILHHLEIHDALKKIINLLRPGGTISFAEPNILNPQVFAERTFRKWFPYVSPDETAFLRWRLNNSLMEVGFTDIQIFPFDWLHPSTPPFLIGIVKRVGYWFERIPLVREFAGSIYVRAIRP